MQVVGMYRAGRNLERQRTFLHAEYALDRLLKGLADRTPPVLQVSLIDGYCFGGGVGISTNAPFVVATPRTQWAMPECNIGCVCMPTLCMPLSRWMNPRRKGGGEGGM